MKKKDINLMELSPKDRYIAIFNKLESEVADILVQLEKVKVQMLKD